jgi:hypothetical protein
MGFVPRARPTLFGANWMGAELDRAKPMQPWAIIFSA